MYQNSDVNRYCLPRKEKPERNGIASSGSERMSRMTGWLKHWKRSLLEKGSTWRKKTELEGNETLTGGCSCDKIAKKKYLILHSSELLEKNQSKQYLRKESWCLFSDLVIPWNNFHLIRSTMFIRLHIWWIVWILISWNDSGRWTFSNSKSFPVVTYNNLVLRSNKTSAIATKLIESAQWMILWNSKRYSFSCNIYSHHGYMPFKTLWERLLFNSSSKDAQPRFHVDSQPWTFVINRNHGYFHFWWPHCDYEFEIATLYFLTWFAHLVSKQDDCAQNVFSKESTHAARTRLPRKALIKVERFKLRVNFRTAMTWFVNKVLCSSWDAISGLHFSREAFLDMIEEFYSNTSFLGI